jgi:NAD(P)-dependent dehydrogenase (short-subunit alcohol dehydrogenase family)
MAKKGFDVLIHGRDTQRIRRAEEAVKICCNENNRVVSLPPIDISTVSGATQVATEALKACKENNLRLSVLMNNAGVFSESLVVTEDKLELTFAVNVMATFVVTSLLLPVLLENSDSRIVIASSISQSGSFRDWDDLHYSQRRFSAHSAYSESKLFDAMLCMEMADRLKSKSGITCNCLDPGTVNTKMLLAGWGACGIAVDDAVNETWLCSSPDVSGLTGRYFVHRNDRKASSAAYDTAQRNTLWGILSDVAPDAASIWNRAD